MSTQLVSVILPLYNTEAFIQKAIESIMAQSYSNWELLICDDGSTDKSLEIANAWTFKDPRIKIFAHPINKGYSFTYNFLLKKAKGEFIMVQDSDDWSDRNRISQQLNILKNHQVDLCVCNAVFYSPDGKPNYLPLQQEGPITLNTPEHWAPATLFFKAEILHKIQGFNPYFDRLTTMDRYFMMEMLTQFKGYYLEKYLYFVQERPDSDHRNIDFNKPLSLKKLIIPDIYLELKRQRKTSGTDWLKDLDFTALDKYEQKLKSNNVYLAEKIRNLATNQIWYKNYSGAYQMIKKTLKIAPFHLKNYRTLGFLLLSRLKIINPN